MNDNFHKERTEVASFMTRLYNKDLTTCSGGNISMRIDDRLVAITPSQVDKGNLTANDIGIVDLDGNNLTPSLKLSMETGMHLAVYKARPEVKAVVHAHPVTATSFTAAGREISTELTGETWALLQKPVLAPYAIMGSSDLAERVAEATLTGDIVMMENHGILTVGDTLFSAYNRLEVLESAARITLITHLLETPAPLTKEKQSAINELFKH